MSSWLPFTDENICTAKIKAIILTTCTSYRDSEAEVSNSLGIVDPTACVHWGYPSDNNKGSQAKMDGKAGKTFVG